MLWRRRLASWLEADRDRSWEGPSTLGVTGVAGRRLLRRGVRPLTSRQAETDRLVERALFEESLARRLDDIALGPPAAAETVSVETDVGPLLLHANDQVMTPAIRDTGHWEESEGVWLRGVIRPGHTVVDCGANVGYFTVLASKCVRPDGLVVAIEPDAANLKLLRANLWQNGCDNVWVVPAAAADRRALLALRRNAQNAGDHQVHDSPAEDDPLVPSVRLDDLFKDLQVDVAKVDCQGADHLVVAGFAETLARSPGARVLVEFWLDGMAERGVDPREVLAGYRRLGRPLFRLAEDGVATEASDDEIIASAAGWEGRWVNLVLGPVR